MEEREDNKIEKEFDELSQKMHVFRFKKVLLDTDVAAFFGITTKEMNRTIKRNIKKFPEEFVFRLEDPERRLFLWWNYSTIRRGSKKNIKYPPLAFTEKGFAMLASVLRTKKALETQLYLLRHCIRLDLQPIIAF